MTGYGRAVQTVNGREFTVELRSVNNRYLDCSVKLPRSVSFAEEAVKQAVKAAVSRGKVDVFISVRSEEQSDTAISLNKAVVEGYLAAMRQTFTSCICVPSAWTKEKAKLPFASSSTRTPAHSLPPT